MIKVEIAIYESKGNTKNRLEGYEEKMREEKNHDRIKRIYRRRYAAD